MSCPVPQDWDSDHISSASFWACGPRISCSPENTVNAGVPQQLGFLGPRVESPTSETLEDVTFFSF